MTLDAPTCRALIHLQAEAAESLADIHERLGRLLAPDGKLAAQSKTWDVSQPSPLRDLAIVDAAHVRKINAPNVDRPDLHEQWLADEAEFDGWHRRKKGAQ